MREAGPVSPPPAPAGQGVAPAPDPARAEVSALTQALVDSQIELALKNLEDKNWAGAIAQAERALGLQPGSESAKQILEQAQGRRAELDKAATEARTAFETGNLQEATRALGRVLELDPKHPVVRELAARLNSTFRSRAVEAQKAAQGARGEADKAKASAAPGFVDAAALLAEGDLLFRRSEFADATQRYVEARDGFDRARRSALTAERAATPAPLPAPTALTLANDRPAPASQGITPSSPVGVTEAASGAGREPARRFVTGKSVVASARVGGGLAGFDTADVKTQKVPQLAGRLEFEVEPQAPESETPVSVRIYLVNQGRKAIKVRTVALTTIVDGGRTSLPGTPRERDVPPQVRALVAEARTTWPKATTSWSLEAVLSSDRDETCTARLDWQ
jgi:tetratricopeptide (TPR) repeat protein